MTPPHTPHPESPMRRRRRPAQVDRSRLGQIPQRTVVVLAIAEFGAIVATQVTE